MFEPIYIQRPVTYAASLMLAQYAMNVGIKNIVYDMHVTLAYSRDPVDWDHNTFQMDPTPLTISGGSRLLTKFDGGAVVLEVESRALSDRWAQFVMAGASWDYPDYRPHITLGYDETFNPEGVKPLIAEIPFDAEIRQWLEVDYQPETGAA